MRTQTATLENERGTSFQTNTVFLDNLGSIEKEGAINRSRNVKEPTQKKHDGCVIVIIKQQLTRQNHRVHKNALVWAWWEEVLGRAGPGRRVQFWWSRKLLMGCGSGRDGMCLRRALPKALRILMRHRWVSLWGLPGRDKRGGGRWVEAHSDPGE